jgi:hypothetical protein
MTPNPTPTLAAFNHIPSGAITIVSNTEYSISFLLESAWNIEGFVEKTLESSWNTGEGEYYWYRVQGVCGSITCDDHGVSYDECEKMTFFTVVPARNIAGLCDQLQSPTINPPVNMRISSIKRYSRPVIKTFSNSDQCNILEEKDFCHVPECSSYCIDEYIAIEAGMDMSVVDSIYQVNMSGGLLIRGNVQTDRYRFYEPEYPIIVFGGGSSLSKDINFYSSGGLFLSGGVYERILTYYEFYSSSGGPLIGGSSTFATPRRSTYVPIGGISFAGTVGFKAGVVPVGGFAISGSYLDSLYKVSFNPSGSIIISGTLFNHLSPGYFYTPRGGINVYLESDSAEGFRRFGFQSLGIVPSLFSFNMGASDFSSELNELSYNTTLTISDQTISPSCGCGPLALSLNLSHNLSNSTAISNFIKRNGLNFPSNVSLRYRSGDSSWRSVLHFAGRGSDGFFMEYWTIIFEFACGSDAWRFSFSTTVRNELRNEGRTNFAIEIPVSEICTEGRSTNIKLNINSGQFEPSTGKKFLATDKLSRQTTTKISRSVDCYVNGILNDYVVYYDNLDLFKNSYWNNIPLDITINPADTTQMPTVNLRSIF